MYKINFNHLYYFLTIAKEGTIVKASKKLNITQPALSHQLKILEYDLGKKLFDRIGKRLVINKNGEAVKEYASKIFRHSEEMVQFLKSDNKQILKIIKIGIVPWLSKNQVYQFIKPLLLSKHIKVQVYQNTLDNLLKDVQNDRIDLILCDSPYSGRSKKLQGHRLSTEPIFCVTSPKNKVIGKFPSNLNDHSIVNFSEACMTADKIDDFINVNKLSVYVVGEFNDSSLARVAIEKGGLIGFLPQSVVKQSIKNKLLIKLGQLSTSKFSMWAITKKNYNNKSIIGDLLKRYK